MPVAPNNAQIALFAETVFGWCEGFIPLRGIAEKGLARQPAPENTWCPAEQDAGSSLAQFAQRVLETGHAAYVIPGTVAAKGQARAAEVQQMQAVVVDLDDCDIAAVRAHLQQHLGQPTLVVESGGRTSDGQPKLHLWWKLTEAVTGPEVADLCRLRGDVALKVGGDRHFASAHQPIRIPGTVYRKNGANRLVRICAHTPIEHDLAEFAAKVAEMPPLTGGNGSASDDIFAAKPSLDAVLTNPVREGDQDAWSRFQGASAAIGHFLRMVHEGRMSKADGWTAICNYNAAMLRPPWPVDRLKTETARLWALHVERYGQASPASMAERPKRAKPVAFSLGALLDDHRGMPDDLIAPRVLTPGGLLVLGGAPKVGKSDFLISWLVHMAAGVPFLGFAPPHPLRVFYLQAEIQYDYLRERIKQIALPADVIAAARDTFFATPKLNMLLDATGVAQAHELICNAFPEAPPDILCIDPIRNLFDGGPDSGGENDNTAMMFFLKDRVEALRDAVNPDAGIILAHHTRKTSKQQVKDDPFQALSGASALRGFYTSGLVMHRPDEDSSIRRLEIELRNGPALPAKVIDKIAGRWVELDQNHQRLVRAEIGAKQDAERLRKHDVILSLLFDEAAKGELYTSTQFAEAFENIGSLGSKHTIQDRVSVLATQGHIKFLRDGSAFGYRKATSRTGYLVVEDMRFKPAETVGPDTGEIAVMAAPVLPSHYKCPNSGATLDVENPEVWVPHKSDEAPPLTYKSDEGQTI
ncbi:MAG: AAA family ATPase [Rhodobacteraceae bacterium]|nr:AAA family ATPase [Paracoccaceae bacterium]